MTKAKAKEIADAKDALRDIIKPGDTVYTILDHVSRSGMSRHIRVLVPIARPAESSIHLPKEWRTTIDFLHPNHSAAIVLGLSRAKRGDGIVIGGCGMDMGFAIVYELSHAIYPTYTCIGDGCPSNEHVNSRPCICGHYSHEHARDGWHYGKCDAEGCACVKFDSQPDRRGPDVVHTDGYALRHRWL